MEPKEKHEQIIEIESKQKEAYETKLLCLLCILGFLFRFYKLNQPKEAIASEKQLGSMIASYIQGIFYVDTAPSLLPILISTFGNMFGMQVEEEYLKKFYLDNIYLKDISLLRSVSNFFGLVLIPVAYFTLKKMNVNFKIIFLISFFFATDFMFVLPSRYYAIESMAPLCSAGIFFCWLNYQVDNKKDFNDFKWLKFTGVALGVSFSLNKNASLDALMILSFIILHINDVLGNKEINVNTIFKQIRYKFIYLILLPIIIYASTMYLSLILRPQYTFLSEKTSSVELISTLTHSPYTATTKTLYYGSIIKIRHNDIPYGFIASNTKGYPGGSSQQITYLSELDDSIYDFWVIEPAFIPSRNYTENPIYPDSNKLNTTVRNLVPLKVISPKRQVKNNDKLRLRHIVSGAYLHSHNVRPVFSHQDYINEVSCYGFEGFEGDENDNFRIELKEYIDVKLPKVVEEEEEEEENKEFVGGDKKELTEEEKQAKRISRNQKLKEIHNKMAPVYAYHSEFRLHHILTDSKLYSRPMKLGEYANSNSMDKVNKYELFTMNDPQLPRTMFKIIWNLPPIAVDENGNIIEDTKSEMVKHILDDNVQPKKLNFINKILEIIKVSKYQSKLFDNNEPTNIINWLFLTKGISLYINEINRTLIYFISNPFIHFISTLTICGLIIAGLGWNLYYKRFTNINKKKSLFIICYLPFVAYLSNLLPWLFIESKSFVDYSTAYYFSLILFGMILHSTIKDSKYLNIIIVVLLLASSIVTYIYSPLIYNLNNPCNAIIKESWDINCYINLPKTNEQLIGEISEPEDVNVVTILVDEYGNPIENQEQETVYIDQNNQPIPKDTETIIEKEIVDLEGNKEKNSKPETEEVIETETFVETTIESSTIEDVKQEKEENKVKKEDKQKEE